MFRARLCTRLSRLRTQREWRVPNAYLIFFSVDGGAAESWMHIFLYYAFIFKTIKGGKVLVEQRGREHKIIAAFIFIPLIIWSNIISNSFPISHFKAHMLFLVLQNWAIEWISYVPYWKIVEISLRRNRNFSSFNAGHFVETLSIFYSVWTLFSRPRSHPARMYYPPLSCI